MEISDIVISMAIKTDKRFAAKNLKEGDLKKLILGITISVILIVGLCLFAMILSYDKANPERMDEEEYTRFINELHNISFNISDSNERFLSSYFDLPLIRFIYFALNEETPGILDMVFVTKRLPITISLMHENGIVKGRLHKKQFLIYYVEDEEILVMKFFDGKTKEREFSRSYQHKVPK